MKKDNGKFLRHHIHSVHSIRDGMLKIKDLVSEAKEHDEAFSLTDHGTISGWMECLKECKIQGVKPVLGIEVYVNNHRDRLFELQDLIAKEKDKTQKKLYQDERDANRKNTHLVLVAKNTHGLMNLIKLNNIGFVDGFYSRPLLTYDEVLSVKDGKDGSPGIIVSSACIGGIIPQKILMAKEKRSKKYLLEAEELINMFKEKFGKDFYLEVQSNGIKEQKVINKALIALGKKTKVKLCIGMDSHYLKQDWSDTHQDLLLLQNKNRKSDVGKFDIKITVENKKGELKSRKIPEGNVFRKGHRAEQVELGDTFGKGKALETVVEVKKIPRVWSYSTDKVWYKSEKELKTEVKKIHKELTENINSICKNNREIYSKIETVELDKTLKLPLNKEAKQQLRLAVKDGLKKKKLVKRKYIDRVKEELKLIEENNFAEYFLILQDITDFAKESNIPLGAARGSATGSFIAYILGIHRVNPFDPRWGEPLPFERFLSASKNSVRITVENEKGKKHIFMELDKIKILRGDKKIVILAKDLKPKDEFLKLESV